ncbi:LTA synthase family protein [Desulfoplanes formicivorans]|uniref:Sulfatase n=1 Tax=Desulfoplanes formicivorans TaxID=1592317 RepID=A0A194AH35_9BACT|nr:LTA synthase family protein [Desulfoplanes formicivorans]GAU08525.1 sulfatase [Desulfoplanes formicivorans]
MKSCDNCLGRYRLFVFFVLACLATFFVVRLVFTVLVFPEIPHTPGSLVRIFATGYAYDLVASLYMSLPLLIYLTILPGQWFNTRINRGILLGLFFVIFSLLLFDGVAEFLFWDEFGVRFNFIAVDYLVYTNEVIGNIWESYPVPALFTGIFAVAAVLVTVFRHHIGIMEQTTLPLIKRTMISLLLGMVMFLNYQLIDTSWASLSNNMHENELAKNGVYQLFSAFINNQLDYETLYATMPVAKGFAALHKAMGRKPQDFQDGMITRRIVHQGQEHKPNVVVIMVESLSAKYLGTFGNTRRLTPFLDELAKDSLLFTRLYATGTRTVRGMEAVTLSVPPTPGRSIVKRPDCENMFSAGFLFKERGYKTMFLYGGYGYFDNMNAFFSSNGFDVVDRSDLADEEITFANIWGVCDEDILRRSLREFDASYKHDQPFFGFVMTTSNHRPFTYPDGKIDIPSHEGRSGGVKYTDYALQQFFKEARTKPWFDNTIFVVVADHCAHSAGKSELPVHRYHIPLFIYAPKLITPGHVDTLASQIDLMPTLLGRLNWSYTSKFFGRDILSKEFVPRAFIGNYQKLGLIENQTLTILEPQKKITSYHIKTETMQDSFVIPAPLTSRQKETTIGYYQSASYLYKHGLNRWNNRNPIAMTEHSTK